MKKIFVLSALALLSVGLLNQPVVQSKEVKENANFVEYAEDYANNQGINLDNKKASIGVGSLDVSPTFVQYGMINEDGKDLYVMRFATAVKGDISSLTYTREAIENVSAEVNKEVKTLYSGISAGSSTYYYDASTKEVSTDESLKGEYYWACYTVKYVNGTNFNTDLSLSFKVNGEEVNKEVTSFNAEYSKVEDGSEAYPYLLATNEELEEAIIASKEASTYQKNYKLVSNLSTSSQFSSTSYNFSGTFDGNGYSITLDQNYDAKRAGLFLTVSKYGTVKNLTVKGSVKVINAVQYNGVITSANYGVISNCVNEATLDVSADAALAMDAGGIAGFSGTSTSLIENCVNKGTLNGTARRLGGIVGRLSSGSVSNCKNYGEVKTYSGASGIVGVVYDTTQSTATSSSITGCKNYGKITAESEWAGGIVAWTQDNKDYTSVKLNVDNCYNEGDVVALNSVGGIVGYGSNTNCNVNNSVNKGNISSTGTGGHIGGIVGMLGSNNSIINCENYGNVLGAVKSSAGRGGIAGSTYSTSEITNCKSIMIDDATVDLCTDKTINVGYIVGYYSNTGCVVTDCGLIEE